MASGKEDTRKLGNYYSTPLSGLFASINIPSRHIRAGVPSARRSGGFDKPEDFTDIHVCLPIYTEFRSIDTEPANGGLLVEADAVPLSLFRPHSCSHSRDLRRYAY